MMRVQRSKNVYVVCLEDWYKMPASKDEIVGAIEECIHIHTRRGLNRASNEQNVPAQPGCCISISNYRFHHGSKKISLIVHFLQDFS